MYNSQNGSNLDQNQNISENGHTATQSYLGGSMLQSEIHPQRETDSGSEFFRFAPSLGNFVVSAENSGKDQITPVSFGTENRFENIDSGFFKPAESFINSTETAKEKPPVKALTESVSDYAKFKNLRLQLANFLSTASELTGELNMSSFTQKLQRLSNKISEEDFKIQIIGTFKNGKSTFINSFLGDDILPAYALPCTAVINEVKYGIKKNAVLHFKNPIPSTLPKELSQKALAHMEKHHMKNIPPMEIPYDEIESYVVIPMGKDPKEMLLESPYEKVELFWPLELLKDGIEIIDSPGLNEHATRTKVTMDYISKADAVIFVLNATTLCSMEEMNFIENNLSSQGFTDLFFVVNRFDMIPEKERARIIKFAQKKLSSFTSFGNDGIFFVSAKNALESKKEADSDKLNSSGMPKFEKSLSDFLTLDRGSSKLYITSHKLKNLLAKEITEKIIPARKAVLETSLSDINSKCRDIVPKIEALETKRDLLYRKVLYAIDQSKVEFKQLAHKNMSETIGLVPMWVENFIPTTKLGVIPSTTKAKQLLNEILTHLSYMLESNNRIWQVNELLPAMNYHAGVIFSSARKEIDLISEDIHKASAILTGAKSFESMSHNISDLGLGSSPAIIQENLQVSKNVAMQVSGETFLAMMSFISPSNFVELISTAFSGATKGSESGIIKKIKAKITNEVTSALSHTTYEYIDSVAQNVANSYIGIAEKMLEPLNHEISVLRNQMESAMADTEKGEEAVNKKRLALENIETGIKNLCSELISFASDLEKKDEAKK